jgi:PAS domain-containing protein
MTGKGLIHPNDKEFLKKTTETHIQSGKNYVAEFRMKHTDGRWIWIQGSGSVVEYDENTHEPLRLCGTHQDISERKTTELREKSRTHVLELLTSGKLLPVILEAIFFGVEQENPAMLCSILLLDDTGKHLVSGASASFPDFYSSAINGIHPILPGELTLMTKLGKEVDVFSSHAYVHVPGQSPKIFCIDVDLTERKLSEEKLKLAASVFTHARESIVITDAAGTILDVNDTFSHTTGYSREEAIGNNARILQSGRQSPEF